MSMKPKSQPMGRMTIMSLPEQIRDLDWGEPVELEIRVAGELIVYGLSTGLTMQRLERTCANPDCEGHCQPEEELHVQIDIAPPLEET